MEELPPRVLPPPPAPRAQSLQESCRRTGLDQSGRRCADCRLRHLCCDETRWVVRRRACEPPLLH